MIHGQMKDKIDCKRFYMPGVALSTHCPECLISVIHNFSEHYLSYPKPNEEFLYYLYCNNCHHEWSINVILKVSLDMVVHHNEFKNCHEHGMEEDLT